MRKPKTPSRWTVGRGPLRLLFAIRRHGHHGVAGFSDLGRQPTRLMPGAASRSPPWRRQVRAASTTISVAADLEHDPEKHALGLDPRVGPVFPRDKREAFARRSCSIKKIARDGDSKKSHPPLG